MLLFEIGSIGDGVYWILVYYQISIGINVYFEYFVEIVIVGVLLKKNVVVEFDEVDNGWFGVFEGGFKVFDDELMLWGVGNILEVVDFLVIIDVLWYGGVVLVGIYMFLVDEVVDIGCVVFCMVIISYIVWGQFIYDNFFVILDIFVVVDIFGVGFGVKVGVWLQIVIVGDDGIFGVWQDYVFGIYNVCYYKVWIQVILSDFVVMVIVIELVFSVDVLDWLDVYWIMIFFSSVIYIVYDSEFNGGLGEFDDLFVQVMIINVQFGDDVCVMNEMRMGCDIEVVNFGVCVVCMVNVLI